MIKLTLISLIIISSLSFIAGCTSVALPNPQKAKGAAENPVDDSKQLSIEGEGPLEISRDTSQGDGDDHSTGDLPAGNISSSGRESVGTPTGEHTGFYDSAAAGDTNEKRAIKWVIYRDLEYKFSLKYPENYVILPENQPLELIDSNLEYRVRFQDMGLAEGATAQYEIPKFTIEVFNLGSQSLESFLDNKGKGAEREEIRIGELAAIKVSFKTLRAPNIYYYFQDMGNTYNLTPQGEYGDEMLASFRILP